MGAGPAVDERRRGAAARLGLGDDALRQDPSTEVGGSGRHLVEAHLHVLDGLGIGDLTVMHVPATRRIHFWLSHSGGAVLMQHPPVPIPLAE